MSPNTGDAIKLVTYGDGFSRAEHGNLLIALLYESKRKIAAGGLALLLAGGCVQQKATDDPALQVAANRVSAAEKACELPPGSIRVKRSNPADIHTRITVFAGCPPNPAYDCLRDYMREHNLTHQEIPVDLGSCQGRGVE